MVSLTEKRNNRRNFTPIFDVDVYLKDLLLSKYRAYVSKFKSEPVVLLLTDSNSPFVCAAQWPLTSSKGKHWQGWVSTSEAKCFFMGNSMSLWAGPPAEKTSCASWIPNVHNVDYSEFIIAATEHTLPLFTINLNRRISTIRTTGLNSDEEHGDSHQSNSALSNNRSGLNCMRSWSILNGIGDGACLLAKVHCPSRFQRPSIPYSSAIPTVQSHVSTHACHRTRLWRKHVLSSNYHRNKRRVHQDFWFPSNTLT